MTHPTIRKNTKTKTCWKKITHTVGPTVNTFEPCGSKTGLKIRIETGKIERGIAVIPLVLITTCSMYRNRVLVIYFDG